MLFIFEIFCKFFGFVNSSFQFSAKFSAILNFSQFGFSVFCKILLNFQVSTIRFFGFLQNSPQLLSFHNSSFRFSAKFYATFKFPQFGFSIFFKIFRNFQVSSIRFFSFLQNSPQLLSFHNSVFRFSAKFSTTFKFQQFGFLVYCKILHNF